MPVSVSPAASAPRLASAHRLLDERADALFVGCVSTPKAVQKRWAASRSATSRVTDAMDRVDAVVSMAITLGAARRPGLLDS